MRITNNMMSRTLLRNLEAAQGRMDQLQNQLSLGLRITRPSDDPVGIQNAMRLKSNISSVTQWKSNADAALGYMNTTDSILADMTSMLQRVRELTVQGANGTLTVDDKGKIALEVEQIADQLHLVANTQVGSKYIFSGTATNKELIKLDSSTDSETGADTSTWLTQGNDQDVTFEVGNNIAIPISVNGKALFGIDETDETTSPGIFETLSKLSNGLKSIDGNGNPIDSKGYLTDAVGHRLDTDGNPIDSEGYHILGGYSTDTDGNLIKMDYRLDTSGNPIDSEGYQVDPTTGERLTDVADLGSLADPVDPADPVSLSPNTLIQDSLGNLDENIANVVALRADLGARTNRLTAIKEQLDSISTNLTQNLSDIQDADMAKTITDFTNQQNVYKAALAVGAKIIQPSLVDYLN